MEEVEEESGTAVSKFPVVSIDGASDGSTSLFVELPDHESDASDGQEDQECEKALEPLALLSKTEESPEKVRYIFDKR